MFESNSPRSPWASISYTEDRDVLGTKLGCNKKDWVEETGEKQEGGVYDRVGNAGKFVVSLSPIKVNLVDYLGQSVG